MTGPVSLISMILISIFLSGWCRNLQSLGAQRYEIEA